MDFVPEVQTMPMQKIVQKIGNGKDSAFNIAHPAAPNVIVTVYETKTGEGKFPAVAATAPGKIVVGFAYPPAEDEFTVVIIG